MMTIFDVLSDGEAVSRIFSANAAPVGSSWMWTLIFPRGANDLQAARQGREEQKTLA
jgi:hypothetical protein